MEANESIEEVKGNQQHGHWPWGTRQLHGSFTTLGSWTLIGLNMRSLTPSGMRGHGCPFRAHGHHHEMRLKCKLSGRERCCRPSSMVVICWDIVGGHRHLERTWVSNGGESSPVPWIPSMLGSPHQLDVQRFQHILFDIRLNSHLMSKSWHNIDTFIS